MLELVQSPSTRCVGILCSMHAVSASPGMEQSPMEAIWKWSYRNNAAYHGGGGSGSVSPPPCGEVFFNHSKIKTISCKESENA